MSEQPEAVAASIRAVETCANCSQELHGRYCSACGQENRNPARIPARRIVEEWLGDTFTFDSRFFKTLVPLVSRPGFLTLEYLAGRRARYVPPLRLFIFLSLLMFLVLTLVGATFNWTFSTGSGEKVPAATRLRTTGLQQVREPAAAVDASLSEVEMARQDQGHEHRPISEPADITPSVSKSAAGSDISRPDGRACTPDALPIPAPDTAFPADAKVVSVPSGPFQVGTLALHLVDESRDDPFTEDPNDHRELVVQLVYPTDAEGKGISPFALSDAIAAATPGLSSIPDWHRKIKGTAQYGVPLAESDEPFPVLVYSHGWFGFPFENAVLLEELASQGFVIAAIAHTHRAGAVEIPGRGLVKSAKKSSERHEHLYETWSPDQRFVLDELRRMTSDPACAFLNGRLDPSRVGFFGWSFGGAAALATCSRDSRCKAGVNLDGPIYPTSETDVPKGPFMLVSKLPGSELWKQIEEHLEHEAYRLFVRGTTHGDFTSGPLVAAALFETPDPDGSDGGPIAPERAAGTVADYVGAFMRTHVAGKPPEVLLAGASEAYPEVYLEVTDRGEMSTSAAVPLIGGVYTVGEAAIEGATVTTAHGSTTTDSFGVWTIEDVPQGATVVVKVEGESLFPLSHTFETGPAFHTWYTTAPTAGEVAELAT